MFIQQIVNRVNDKLAGELLTYEELKVFLDETIDDINIKLNSTYPAFSEFTSGAYPNYPNYNFFPERYIRTVVIPGAAYKFYVTDEEGINTAEKYGFDYTNALYFMLRDHLSKVPVEFRGEPTGYAQTPIADKSPPVNFHNLL